MAQILVRNLDDHVKDRLRARAQRNGNSLEQEVRDILTSATREYPPVPLGATIATHLCGRGDAALTTNEIMALTRGE